MGKQKNKVNPERQRTRFSKEFKLEAVRLLELGQKPATQLALELGVVQLECGSNKAVGACFGAWDCSPPDKGAHPCKDSGGI